jgi:hypothetical protein
MKHIQKQVVAYFKGIFGMMNDGGLWIYPDGQSSWRLNDNTITLIGGDINDVNKKAARHMDAAGYKVEGI